jgi:lipopolysaccharide/colanic/teichoic acid biosynthesis glycosyltransferase
MRLDLRYLDTWSLTLDASILLRTVRSLFRRARSV